MDLRKIKALIDLLEKSNLAELEIKEGEESVRLARHSRVVATAPVHAAPAHPEPAPRAPVATPALAATASEAQGKGGKDVPDGHMIRSPMVGVASFSFMGSAANASPPPPVTRAATSSISTVRFIIHPPIR